MGSNKNIQLGARQRQLQGKPCLVLHQMYQLLPIGMFERGIYHREPDVLVGIPLRDTKFVYNLYMINQTLILAKCSLQVHITILPFEAFSNIGNWHVCLICNKIQIKKPTSILGPTPSSNLEGKYEKEIAPLLHAPVHKAHVSICE